MQDYDRTAIETRLNKQRVGKLISRLYWFGWAKLFGLGEWRFGEIFAHFCGLHTKCHGVVLPAETEAYIVVLTVCVMR